MDISQDSKLKSMSQSGGSSQQQKSMDSIQALLSWNDLNYSVSRVNSVVKGRNLKEYFASQQEYTSGSGVDIVFNVQTGSQYVQCRNSMLVFDLEVTADTATTAHFGIGSAFNVFREVTIQSRSGTEVDRYQSCNLHRAHWDRLNESNEWFQSVGRLMGYESKVTTTTITGEDTTAQSLIFTTDYPTFAINNNPNNPNNPNSTIRYMIPLSKLASIFASDKMMHSDLASGMRVEIKLDRAANAFVCNTADTSIAFKVINPKLLLDTHELTDGATSELKKIAARSGLEYEFAGIYTESDASTSTRFSIEVNRAVAKADEVVAISRLVANINKSDVDSLASEVITAGTDGEVTSFQARLGSMYFPNRELSNVRELYYNALYVRHKLQQHHTHPSQLTFDDFESGGLAQLHATMESNSLLKHSGSALNNSRSLSLDIQFNSGIAGTGRQIDVFLIYRTIVRSFLNNTVVVS
jgi:hypothetical protein